ncbi:hypothetical protein [Azohydromonas caseinilytica]|uniref:Uncharacterized protein n=1 Tax=Azohydromonas caseinilytica TaxID=2728836 RepID=A0A848FBU3_9BURK|nr:hypothetical protein [Azohydromonas caseinilytica]NML16974.1 hypothetical protein [Azohydromonas caseinilytica]
MKVKRRPHAHAERIRARRHEQHHPVLASQPCDAGGLRTGACFDHEMRVWRESCRDARAATRKQRAAIRETWRAWPGPVTVLCFRYIVDLHTGALDQRRQAAVQATLGVARADIEAALQASAQR